MENKRPKMEWIQDETLQLILTILWNAEGVSMQDWKECSNAIENYYGGLIDCETKCAGKDLVIEDLEKNNLILTTKYTEAKDKIINDGGDIQEFEDVGKLVKDYLESKSVVEDMDGNIIYKEGDTDEGK